ncbi:MAG: TylF/MycF/NovP-related O-methyltransferase [Chlamydiales bacterium]|nr:TylF/MycF/NovP-related O-methyltransferase [Chlamydiales bacterium]
MGLKTLIKRPFKSAIKNLVNMVEKARHESVNDLVSDHVLSAVRQRALKETVDFIYESMPTAIGMNRRTDVIPHAMVNRAIKGLVLEFGVFSGESVNRMAKLAPNETIHGFDSFEGLPENWDGHSLGKGTFSLKGKLPKVRENVCLHQGWFNETAPAFFQNCKDVISLLHIDCDLYQSTKTVLDAAKDHIVPGTIIVLDEFFGYPFFQQHEFRAFFEFAAEHQLKYRFMAYGGSSVALIVEEKHK